MMPTVNNIPFVSTKQIVEIDRRMVEDFGIPLEQMMERAGEHLSTLAQQLYPEAQRVTICVGPGNNGGGGLVAARYLAQTGVEVTVVLALRSDALHAVPQLQLDRAEAAGVRVIRGHNEGGREEVEWKTTQLIVDALVGYNMRGALHGAVRELVLASNGSPAPVLSLDLPTGVWPEMKKQDLAVQADATMAIAIPKQASCDLSEYHGALYVADIGVPQQIYTDIGIDLPPLFGEGPIVHVGTHQHEALAPVAEMQTNGALYRIVMKTMITLMKWMNRAVPGIARPIVRYVASNEVIACGMRLPDEPHPVVIYNPDAQRDHRFVKWSGTRKEERTKKRWRLVGDLLVYNCLPNAATGEVYRVVADDAQRVRTVQSPRIAIKESTERRDDLFTFRKADMGGTLSWEEVPTHAEAMIYFIAIANAEGEGVFGSYTRETRLTVPALRQEALHIGGESSQLVSGGTYTAHLYVVDYDGWVPLTASNTFEYTVS